MEINIRGFQSGDDFCNVVYELTRLASSFHYYGGVTPEKKGIYAQIFLLSNSNEEKISRFFLDQLSWTKPCHWGTEAFDYFLELIGKLEIEKHHLVRVADEGEPPRICFIRLEKGESDYKTAVTREIVDFDDILLFPTYTQNTTED